MDPAQHNYVLKLWQTKAAMSVRYGLHGERMRTVPLDLELAMGGSV